MTLAVSVATTYALRPSFRSDVTGDVVRVNSSRAGSESM